MRDEFERRLLAGDSEAIFALLRTITAQVVRTRSFPPPHDYRRWDDDAVGDLLAEMVAKKGPAFAVDLLVAADDQPSVERLLHRTVENFLKDQAKSTAHGLLRSRLKNVLGGDARFRHVTSPDEGWGIADGSADWWTGDRVELERVAWTVRGVFITSWNRAGRTPAGARLALCHVSEAVLTQAAAIVRAEVLSRVLLARFRTSIAPESARTEPIDQAVEAVSAPGDIDVGDVLATISVSGLWALLTPRQRAVVPLLTASSGVVAAEIGIGTREASALQEQVKEIIRLATVDDPSADVVVLALAGMAASGDATMDLGRPSAAQAGLDGSGS